MVHDKHNLTDVQRVLCTFRGQASSTVRIAKSVLLRHIRSYVRFRGIFSLVLSTLGPQPW